MAYIVEVQHKTLGEVTQEEVELAAIESPEELMRGLRRFYPDIDFESPVTVIRWSSVDGKLVEDYRLVRDTEEDMRRRFGDEV